MPKSQTGKISKKEIGKYFFQLCVAISETKNEQEAAELLKDLLSYKEATMITKRLKIAEMLLEEKTYKEIQDELKVGTSKISRVYEWMKVSGNGYKKAVERLKNKKTPADFQQKNNFSDWRNIKKRFPLYHWPELLIEDLIIHANKKQFKKVENVIAEMEKMKEKTPIFNQLKKVISKNNYYQSKK